MASARVLVVEDEPDMLTILRDNLEFEGYRVSVASSGEEGLAIALRERPHLVLLDVMLPRMSGLDVCRRLRAQGINSPVIMITARNADGDRIAGLDIGADDYIGKPFSIGEVLARLRAHLRRAAEHQESSDEFRFGTVVVDLRRQTVTRDGNAIEMSSREFQLLAYFIKHRGELVTRDQILSDVWGYSHAPMTRTVDNFVSNLRSKLEPDPQHPTYILTAYGTGYRFAV